MHSCLITGATGFVGGHLAEACVQRGWTVRALVRPTSDTELLKQLGVRLIEADLSDRAALPQALQGVDVVIHTAAKVGDWGQLEDFRKVNVEALRGLLEACRQISLHRFVHMSSLGVYAARHHHGTDESEPLPETTHLDAYTQTKIEAEKLALGFASDHQLPLVILRPGFIYGPRDRTVLPRLIDKLRRRAIRYIGDRRRALNCIYIKNLVDATLLAVDEPKAIGQVYNLTDGETVSKRQFIQALAAGVGLKPPRPVGIPLGIARMAAWWMEKTARKANSQVAPELTQAAVKFMGLNLDFSIEKARRELQYRPMKSFEQGMMETTAWYRNHQ